MVVTRTRDKESSTPTVGVPWALALEDDYDVALEGDHHRRGRSGHIIRARQHVGDARVSCHATCETITSLNRLGAKEADFRQLLRAYPRRYALDRPAVASVVAGRVSSTLGAYYNV